MKEPKANLTAITITGLAELAADLPDYRWYELRVYIRKAEDGHSEVNFQMPVRPAERQSDQICVIDGVIYDRVPVDLSGEPAFLQDGSPNSAYKPWRSRPDSNRRPTV